MVVLLKRNSILVARAVVVDPHCGYFPVRLLNFGDEAVIILHENTKLGNLQTADIQVSTLLLKRERG